MSNKNIFENEFDEDDEDSEEDNEYEEDDQDDEGDDPDDEDDDDDPDSEDDEVEDSLDGEILKKAYYCDAEPCNFISTKNPCAGIRVINCKSGKRIELSSKILSALRGPKEISFLYAKSYLILVRSDEHIFPLRGKKQNTIYSSSLVAEITKRFKLDFSSCTCLSFPHYKMIDDNAVRAIAIVMK